MEVIHAEMAVIGSGPSGQKAAIQAAKIGKKVVMIEEDLSPGGVCLFSGTIPSKTFRQGVIDLTRFYERNFLDDSHLTHELTISAINSRLQQVIKEERNLVNRQLQRNHIRIVQGNARFKDPHCLQIFSLEEKLIFEIHSETSVIAVGSKPRHPIDVPFDTQVIFDSTTLLTMEKIPKTMLVLGGGVIGSEYASFFSALETEVTVIDKKDHILPFLDEEIGVHLQTALINIGLQFRGETKPTHIERCNNSARVMCDNNEVYEADTLLYALGREANTQTLCLENAGLAVNERGYLSVNPLFQTDVAHIYAIGDVIGGACLASTCMEQGRLVARYAFGLPTHYFPVHYPLGIYSIPEISTIGMTEQEAQQRGFHYEVGRAYYYEIARSHIVGGRTGLFKILFHAETMEILGIHIIGRNATELIHIGQCAMNFHAHIDFFVDQIFNYPTYAEGYRIAALNGMNKIKHRR